MIDGISTKDLTLSGLLGIFFLMWMLGWIVPKWFWKAKADESEKWESAYKAEHEARLLSDKQNLEMLELTRATHSLMVAFMDMANKAREESGGAHVVPTQR